MDANSVVAVREVSGYWPEIIGASITGVLILLAAIIGAKYGLQTYFRKREHELILKRYLDEGIDLISKEVTNAEQAFLYNYRKASEILQQLKVFKKADLSVEFLNVQTYLGAMPIQKLRYLLGDDILATAIQELLIFIDSDGTYLNKFFYSESLKIQQALQVHKNPETLDQFAGELTDAGEHQLAQQFSIFTQYAFVQTELQRITSLLERRKTLTWSDLDEFQKGSEIKEDIKMVKKMLAIVQEAKRSTLEQKPT